MDMQLSAKSKVAEFREKAGLTQAQLAVLVGVTANTIQNWESGKSGLEQIVKFIKLCTVLDCNLEDLVDESSASNKAESKPGEFSIQDLHRLRRQWGTSTTASSTTKKTTNGNSSPSVGRK